MSPDPVKLIGLDKLLQPGPEKLAVPPELSDWARRQAERELKRRTDIVMECIEEGRWAPRPGVKPDRMEVKEEARSYWTERYSGLGGQLAFNDYWRSVQQAGLLEEYGWKPVKEKGE
jgi:hypothetical protein